MIFSTSERPENEDLADFGHLNDAEAMRERFPDSKSAIWEYEADLLDFTQKFVVEAWNHERQNFVISHFNLHTVFG